MTTEARYKCVFKVDSAPKNALRILAGLPLQDKCFSANDDGSSRIEAVGSIGQIQELRRRFSSKRFRKTQVSLCALSECRAPGVG